MAKPVLKNDALTSFFNDSDNFIQSHIDSYFPPAEESSQEKRFNLTGEDTVGNEVQVEEEVKGAIDTVLDALGQVWDAIAEVLSEVAEAVKDAVSVVVDFFVNKIMEGIKAVFSPILNSINKWVENLERVINGSYAYYKKNGELNTYWRNKLEDTLFGSGFYACLGMGSAIVATMYLVSGLSAGVGSVVMGIVVPMIVSFALSAVLNTQGDNGTLPFDLPTTFSRESILILFDTIVGMVDLSNSSLSYRSNNTGLFGSSENSGIILSYLGNIAGLIGILLTMYMGAKADPTGSLMAGLVIGTAAWALPYYIIALSLTSVSMIGSIIFGSIGLVFSLPAIVSTITSVPGNYNPVISTLYKTSGAIAFISALLFVGSIVV